MYCTIYRLRHDGRRLEPDQVRATAVTGWLVIGDARAGHGWPADFSARIEGIHPRRAGAALLGPTLYRVTRAGMLIKGREFHPDGHGRRQTWFCVPAVQSSR